MSNLLRTFFHTHLAVPAVVAISEDLIVLEGASGGVFASHHGIEGGQGASALFISHPIGVFRRGRLSALAFKVHP